jgi:hypothetical protein
MFEKLLQAERALSKGSLDEAERAFWQLIALDSQNAIAVAGLARVAFERGDLNLSRLFAEKALSLDPDSYAAKRIVESVQHKGVGLPAEELPDLPLLAAERLEALSRRHATRDHEQATLVELPPEPLRERREAGRQSAAAAAAAAAEIGRAAPKDAGLKKAKAPKATPAATGGGEHLFAAAESEAAIEAVGRVDNPAPVPVREHPKLEPIRFTPRRVHVPSRQPIVEVVEQVGEDESVAVRPTPVEGPKAEAPVDEGPSERSEEDAEAEAAELARLFRGEVRPVREPIAAEVEAEPAAAAEAEAVAAEVEAVEVEAEPAVEVEAEPAAAAEGEAVEAEVEAEPAAEGEAVEAESPVQTGDLEDAAGQPIDLAGEALAAAEARAAMITQAADAALSLETAALEPRSAGPEELEPWTYEALGRTNPELEQDAEARALREALEFVRENPDKPDDTARPPAPAEAAPAEAAPAEPATRGRSQDAKPPSKPQPETMSAEEEAAIEAAIEEALEPTEPAPEPAAPEDGEAKGQQPGRRRGFLRRMLGD